MSGPFFGGDFFGGGFFAPNAGGVRGKGGKRPKAIKLSEVRDRESTAEYLKSQLRLKHLPDRPFIDESAQARDLARKESARQRKAEARMRSEAAAAEFAEQRKAAELAAQERLRANKIRNENLKVLLMLAASIS